MSLGCRPREDFGLKANGRHSLVRLYPVVVTSRFVRAAFPVVAQKMFLVTVAISLFLALQLQAQSRSPCCQRICFSSVATREGA